MRTRLAPQRPSQPALTSRADRVARYRISSVRQSGGLVRRESEADAAIDELDRKRLRAAFVGPRSRAGLEVDDPIVQWAGDPVSMDDAFDKRTAPVWALVFQCEHTVVFRAEDRNAFAADSGGAGRKRHQVVEHSDVVPGDHRIAIPCHSAAA